MSTKYERLKTKIIRFLKQKSTQAGIGLFIAIGGALGLGIHADVATFTNSATGIVTALAGLYALVMNFVNIFRDEEKSVDKARALRDLNDT